MTTIATDGTSMAADGLRLHGDTIVTTRAEKIRRLSDGRIVGTSGDVSFGMIMIEWLEHGGDVPTFPSGADCGTVLVLNTDGTASMYDSYGKEMPAELPAAIGSGMDLAIGAMEYGASPKEAVEIACRREVGSGGVISVVFMDTEEARAIRIIAQG